MGIYFEECQNLIKSDFSWLYLIQTRFVSRFNVILDDCVLLKTYQILIKLKPQINV